VPSLLWVGDLVGGGWGTRLYFVLLGRTSASSSWRKDWSSCSASSSWERGLEFVDRGAGTDSGIDDGGLDCLASCDWIGADGEVVEVLHSQPIVVRL